MADGEAALRQRRSRAEGLASASAELLLAAALSVLPLVWRAVVGAGRFPAGDAWAYERIFDTFHRTGDIVLVGWNDLTLVGVLPVTEWWVSLVGYGDYQLYLLGAFMGFVALLGLRDLVGSLGVRRRLLPIAVVGTYTGFVGIAGTYLADTFYFAGALWSVALAMRILTAPRLTRRTEVILAVVGALCAAYAFSVRQHAAATAVAVTFVLWTARRGRSVAWWCYASCFLALALPLYIWRRGLANGGSEMLVFAPRSSIAALYGALVTFALVPLPFLFGQPRRWLRTLPAAPYWCLVLIGLVAAPFSLTRPLLSEPSLVGELIEEGGTVKWVLAFGLLLTTPWSLRLACQALWSGLARPWDGRSKLTNLSLLLLLTGGLVVASSVVTAAYYTRYTLVSAALLVALLQVANELGADVRDHSSIAARPTTGRTAWLSVVGVLMAAFFAYWELDRSASSVPALTDAAAVAHCAGIPPEQIDGGFVWDGMHSTGVVDSSRQHVAPEDGLPPTENQSVFVEMNRRAVVLASPPEDLSGLAVFGPFHSGGILPGSRTELWLITRTEDAGAVAECAPSG